MSNNKNIDYLIKENIDLINKLIKQNETLISNNNNLIKEIENIKETYLINEHNMTIYKQSYEMDIGHFGFGC